MLEVPTAAPFSFAQTLAFVERFPALHVQGIPAGDRLSIPLAVAGGATTVSLFEVRGRLVADIDDQDLAAQVGAFIGAGDDLAAFYAAAAGDPPMARLVEKLHGLHHVRFVSLAQIAVYSVMMQRAPVHIAASLLRRFLAVFGVPTGTQRAMPALDALAALDADTIASVIKHRGKAERIVDVVRGVMAIGETFLRTAPYAEARDALLAIRGVGPFSAAAILLRGLGRMDELPWIPAFGSVARELYGRVVEPSELVRRYGTTIGYWSFYAMTGYRRAR